MSNVVNLPKSDVAVIDPQIIESIVTKGDLSGLNQVQKVQYYNYRCKQIGLDPSAKPFDLLNLSGKQVLYANAGATQQLCNIHRLSTQITGKERVDDIYIVSVRVTGADGRVSENQGAVSIIKVEMNVSVLLALIDKLRVVPREEYDRVQRLDILLVSFLDKDGFPGSRCRIVAYQLRMVLISVELDDVDFLFIGAPADVCQVTVYRIARFKPYSLACCRVEDSYRDNVARHSRHRVFVGTKLREARSIV